MFLVVLGLTRRGTHAALHIHSRTPNHPPASPDHSGPPGRRCGGLAGAGPAGSWIHQVGDDHVPGEQLQAGLQPRLEGGEKRQVLQRLHAQALCGRLGDGGVHRHGRRSVYVTKGPAYGIMNVTLDGVAQKSVSLYAAATAYKRKAFSRTGLANGTHTPSLSWAGKKVAAASAKTIDLDALGIQGRLIVPTSTPDTDADLDANTDADADRDAHCAAHGRAGRLLVLGPRVRLGRVVGNSGRTAPTRISSRMDTPQ